MAKGKRSIGSISLKPNGRWYASMSVRDQAGRSKREALGGFSTRAEADRAIARPAVAVESDTFVPRDRTPGDIPVGRLAPVDCGRGSRDDLRELSSFDPGIRDPILDRCAAAVSPERD